MIPPVIRLLQGADHRATTRPVYCNAASASASALDAVAAAGLRRRATGQRKAEMLAKMG